MEFPYFSNALWIYLVQGWWWWRGLGFCHYRSAQKATHLYWRRINVDCHTRRRHRELLRMASWSNLPRWAWGHTSSTWREGMFVFENLRDDKGVILQGATWIGLTVNHSYWERAYRCTGHALTRFENRECQPSHWQDKTQREGSQHDREQIHHMFWMSWPESALHKQHLLTLCLEDREEWGKLLFERGEGEKYRYSEGLFQ